MTDFNFPIKNTSTRSYIFHYYSIGLSWRIKYINALLHKTYVDCYIWWQNHEGFKNLPFGGALPVWFPISSIYHWSSYLGNASTSEAFEFQRWGGGDLRGEAEHWQLDVRSKYVVHGTNNLKHRDFISKIDYNNIKKFDILTKWIFVYTKMLFLATFWHLFLVSPKPKGHEHQLVLGNFSSQFFLSKLSNLNEGHI